MTTILVVMAGLWVILAVYSFSLLKRYRDKKIEINKDPTIPRDQKKAKHEDEYDLLVKDRLFGFSVKSFITLTTNTLLVVVTTVGVYTSAQSFKEQSVLNRAQNILEYQKERAYITLLDFEQTSNEKNLNLVITFNNSGQTPAKKVFATLYYTEDLNNPSKKKKITDIGSSIDSFSQTGVTIPPERNWTTQVQLSKEETLKKFQNESVILLEVKYLDYMDTPRLSDTAMLFRNGKFEVMGNQMD